MLCGCGRKKKKKGKKGKSPPPTLNTDLVTYRSAQGQDDLNPSPEYGGEQLTPPLGYDTIPDKSTPAHSSSGYSQGDEPSTAGYEGGQSTAGYSDHGDGVDTWPRGSRTPWGRETPETQRSFSIKNGTPETGRRTGFSEYGMDRDYHTLPSNGSMATSRVSRGLFSRVYILEKSTTTQKQVNSSHICNSVVVD